MSSPTSTISSNGFTSSLQSYLSSNPPTNRSIVNLDKLYQRLNILEYENQKLMESHEMLVSEVNHRSEMHIMEVSKLHRKINETETINQELRALCSMFENEAKKTRMIVKENDKIRKYSNEFIKQELRTFAEKTRELSFSNEQLIIENKELKRLCLYLDEQRFDIINMSKKHVCSSCQKVQDDIFECNDNIVSNSKNEKENRIEMLTKEMQTSICLMKDNDEDSAITTTSNDSISNENSKNNDLLSYIYSLENRVNNLEIGAHKHLSQMSSEFESNDEDNDLIRVSPLLIKNKNQLTKSHTNGGEIKILSDVCIGDDVEMSSANKLFNNTVIVNDTTGNSINLDKEGNHEHDCIVYGGCHNFNECISNNFVRFLSKIDEDEEINSKSTVKNSLSDILTDLSSSQSPNIFTPEIPPPMADVSESIGRLSFCSSSNNSLNSTNNTILTHNSYQPSNECYYEEIRLDNKLSSPIYTPISKIPKTTNENSEDVLNFRSSIGHRRQPSSYRRSVSMNNGIRRHLVDSEGNKLPPIRIRTGYLQNNTTSPSYSIPSEEDKRILQRACQLQFNQKINKKENQKATKILVDQKSGNIKAELTAI
uniref:CCDC92/74 N-terminal domain-containing protein n=1 Tax=Strongyloides stercoralis TaxID=6248 RepID=A0A0K0EQ82_STRER